MFFFPFTLQMNDDCLNPIIVYTGDLLDITSEGSISVLAEGITVCDNITTFMDALCCLMATFYVFNMTYTPGLNRTLSFFQRILLNLQDTVKVPAKVLAVVQKLNNNLAAGCLQ